MKYTIIILSLMFFPISSANEENIIRSQILKNRPRINRKYLSRLTKSIHKATSKWRIPSKIFTAILMQESSYRLNAKNCRKFSCDYGISQVNSSTAKAFKFDKARLLVDLDYSVDAGAQVLSWFYMTYAKREKNWFLRYNVGTRRSAIKSINARDYLIKVKKYL